jgi:hypothetical protein
MKYPNIREKYEAWEDDGRLMGFDLSSELQRELKRAGAKNDPWGHHPPSGLGPLAERVMYAGPIQGYQPSTRKGLVCEYLGNPPIPAYKATIDSTERALKAELQSRAAEMRECIHKARRE